MDLTQDLGYEPIVKITCLRGCVRCGTKHPLAFDPPLSDDACPRCGHPSISPEPPQTVKAKITGAWLGRTMIRIGRLLNQLNRRIE